MHSEGDLCTFVNFYTCPLCSSELSMGVWTFISVEPSKIDYPLILIVDIRAAPMHLL